jgi:hypothetical protein
MASKKTVTQLGVLILLCLEMLWLSQGVGFLVFSLLSMLVIWFQIQVFGQYCGCHGCYTEFYLMFNYLYKVSHELGSIFRDLIPELMLTNTSYTQYIQFAMVQE